MIIIFYRFVINIDLYKCVYSTLGLILQQKKRTEEQTWLEPWGELPENQRYSLAVQLEKEITQQHPLFGKHHELMGKSFANDDLLVLVDASEWVVMHLTWNGSGDSCFPLFQPYATWSEFVNNKMAIDNESFLT